MVAERRGCLFSLILTILREPDVLPNLNPGSPSHIYRCLFASDLAICDISETETNVGIRRTVFAKGRQRL